MREACGKIISFTNSNEIRFESNANRKIREKIFAFEDFLVLPGGLSCFSLFCCCFNKSLVLRKEKLFCLPKVFHTMRLFPNFLYSLLSVQNRFNLNYFSKFAETGDGKTCRNARQSGKQEKTVGLCQGI